MLGTRLNGASSGALFFTPDCWKPNMQMILHALKNPAVTELANTQVLMAVLIALLIYRLISPIIDLLNPITMLVNALFAIRAALFRKTVDMGTRCFTGNSRHHVLDSNNSSMPTKL